MTTEKRPEISVIVPVYKVERYLNECIASILTQTFADFELILVDDGSPDNCPALCDAAARKDSRIRVIHKPNGGVGSARNAGLDAFSGRYVTFVDSDDTIAPQYLEKLHESAVCAQADVAVCNFVRTDETGHRRYHAENLVKKETLSKEDVLRRLLLEPFAVVWAKLYGRAVIAGHRFGDRTIGEDAIFQAEVFAGADTVVCLGEPLYFYRQLQTSVMHRKRTVRSLVDQVDANYTMFQCALDHGLTDVLCIYYWLVVKYFWQNWKAITPEERQSGPAQKALACRRTAWQQLKQAGALTPKNVFLAAVHRVSPPLYLKLKR